MTKTAVVLCLLLTGSMFAQEGSVPKGVPHLDHVFVVVMENHGYSQIIGNPSAPFTNQYAKSANSASNYFAIGHPSSTNYLEMVGGSNFGVRSDNSPDFHNTNCTPNIMAPGFTTTDFPSSPNVCPIAGQGMDAATPAVDMTNECPNPAATDPCCPPCSRVVWPANPWPGSSGEPISALSRSMSTPASTSRAGRVWNWRSGLTASCAWLTVSWNH